MLTLPFLFLLTLPENTGDPELKVISAVAAEKLGFQAVFEDGSEPRGASDLYSTMTISKYRVDIKCLIILKQVYIAQLRIWAMFM